MTSLKSLLKENRPLLGLTTQHVTEPWLARLWKASGWDFVFLEYEHGLYDEQHEPMPRSRIADTDARIRTLRTNPHARLGAHFHRPSQLPAGHRLRRHDLPRLPAAYLLTTMARYLCAYA